jgi:hypothetical protein
VYIRTYGKDCTTVILQHFLRLSQQRSTSALSAGHLKEKQMKVNDS